MKIKIMRALSFFMTIFLIISSSFSVYASDEHPWEGGLGLQLYYNKDEILKYVKDTGEFWLYAASEMGAIVRADFVKFAENYKKMDEILETEKDIGVYVNDNNEMKGLFFSKEFMTQLKSLLDQYAKENEPYYMVNTLTLDAFLGSPYSGSKLMYDTAKNLLEDSPSGVIAFGAYYSTPTNMYFVDIGHDFKNVSPVKGGSNLRSVIFYNNETWGQSSYIAYLLNLSLDDDAIKTAEEFKEKANYTYDYGTRWDYPIGYSFYVYPSGITPGTYPYDCRGPGSSLNLITKERRRIRVFNTYGDFQNYTLGKRNVYYTSNYYDYVPEDLSVSIDDLEKEIDDLSKVIDQLLDQISKDTDESEIEELLRQILEELRNGGGSGGGGGGSGGDVTVDIDLSTTNSWLSKILAKVTQIFDKLSETATGAVDTVNTKLQETLDEILSTLKSIRRWTIADTVFDGVDALADVASLLKDFLTAPAAAIGTAASSLGETANMLTDKFPFSIPWDMAALVTLLSAEPQAPVFKLPIAIESAGIEEYIEIDMSQFEYLSTIMRGMLSILYAYGILSMTTKVMDIGGKK